MSEITGWLLDVYPGMQDGVVVWILGQDGERHRLRQPFPVTFYAAGSPSRLRLLWQHLQASPLPLRLSRTERRELFAAQPLPVLAIQAPSPVAQSRLFYQTAQAFPDLTYFDADLSLPLHYAARYGAFPLARCAASTDQDGLIQEMRVLDSPWDIDPPPAPLRLLRLEPDSDPTRRSPRHLLVHSPRGTCRLSLEPQRPLLINLRAILKRHDPDLLLTASGDTWLLPHLLECSQALGLPLPLNRDEERQPAHHKELSYFSYGQVVYRGRQVHLFGRWHIDSGNAMLWDDYQLEGVLETARITSLPVQTAARVSPGTGISTMQMITALRQDILVPWHKQQSESPKTALQMFSADQGGMVYQPLVGVHQHVAEIDFVSMYPGIMVRFNISPETAGGQPLQADHLIKIQSPSRQASPDEAGLGLVPQTLAPLLDKRLELKARLTSLSNEPGARWDPRRKIYKARSSAHKWLLVTCFGYLGYKNARFGRIEAHEAVTAYAREALLRAKEAAEDSGFTVLHLYVDGLWVQKPGASQVADFQPLLDTIAERTGLPIALDGIYRWVAFLPSRVDARLPVPNRYFGVFQDGSLKVRGIDARRGDTPHYIAEAQIELLQLLSKGGGEQLTAALTLLRGKLARLRAGRVPLEELLVSQKLSRELDEYRQPSPSARAAAQLLSIGRSLRAGQRVRFLYTRGEPGVYAWDMPDAPNPAALDVARYVRLLLRAAHNVLQPFGVSEANLRQWVSQTPAHQLPLPSPPRKANILALENPSPLFVTQLPSQRW